MNFELPGAKKQMSFLSGNKVQHPLIAIRVSFYPSTLERGARFDSRLCLDGAQHVSNSLNKEPERSKATCLCPQKDFLSPKKKNPLALWKTRAVRLFSPFSRQWHNIKAKFKEDVIFFIGRRESFATEKKTISTRHSFFFFWESLKKEKKKKRTLAIK